MSKEIYRIEIPIETTDKYSDGLKKAEKDVKGFESTTKKAANGARDLGNSSDEAAKGVNKVGESARKSEKDVTKFQSSVQKTRDRLKQLTSSSWQITVRAVDHATRVVTGINSLVQRVASRGYNFTFRAIDMATRTIGGIHRAITGIPAMVTVALSVVGVNKLKEATLGSAMNFEDYGVAMNHWLRGDQKAQKELMTWMGRKADKTPYSSADIFPAMTGAVALAGNDQKNIQRLTSAAIDMAALSGGQQTVEDAMQALTSAKMGNMTRMKLGFNMQMTKKEYDKIGFNGFIDRVEAEFKGGAEELSKTGRGMLSTLSGYMSSQFRMMGDGILDSMKPRLRVIIKWLDDNQDKWGKWKDSIQKTGTQASEWVFGRLEKGFEHLKTNYLENDAFKKLDFMGKVNFVMDDVGGAVSEWWSSKGKPVLQGWWDSSGKPWAEETGLAIGEALYNGIVTGMKEGLSSIGGMWSNAYENIKEDPFSKESASSAGGAAVATLGAGALGAMVLSPLLKVAGNLVKGGKAVGAGLIGAGRWVTGKGKGKGGKGVTPVTASVGSKTGGATTNSQGSKSYSELMQERHNNGQKVKNTPKPSRFPKMPKGITGVLKKVPVLGTLIGVAAIAGSSKEQMPGTVGAVGGGIAGAKAGAIGGAALGSVVPGIGTAIGAGVGGLVGGIGGAIGGEKIGNWFGENWDSIKEGASDAVEWVEKKWGKTASWFEKSVWTPISGAAINATNFSVGAWSYAKDGITRIWKPFSSSFQNMVWSPISTGVETAGKFIGEKFETAKNVATATWKVASGWFEDIVWSPLATGAEAIGNIIGGKFDTARGVVSAAWNTAESWFQDTVWTPISTAVEVVGSHIGKQFETGYTVMTSAWSAAESWFEGNVWSPLKVGATAAATVFAEKLAVIKAGAAGVGEVTSNRVDLLKTGLSAGYRVFTKRGSETTGLSPDKEYANGGYINRPHLGLVGEAGPEMIIPLSSGRRNRAMDLYQRTGQMLGVQAYADGGLVPTGPIVPMSSGPAVGGGFIGNISISAPISVTMDRSDSIEEVADKILNQFGTEVVEQLKEAFSNLM